MIFLAAKENDFERIQIVRSVLSTDIMCNDPAKKRIVWEALNWDGSKELISAFEGHESYEDVLNILIEKYGSLFPSKRKVDSGTRHIESRPNSHFIYDNNGKLVEKLGKTNYYFFDPGCGEILQRVESSDGFPDYYEHVREIHKGRLWSAFDIDCRDWVCLTKDGEEITVIARSEEYQDAVNRATRFFS